MAAPKKIAAGVVTGAIIFATLQGRDMEHVEIYHPEEPDLVGHAAAVNIATTSSASQVISWIWLVDGPPKK